MTTHPNAQLLQDAYQAIGRGDLQPLLGMLTEDVTFEIDLGPLAGTYAKDAVPQFFGRMTDIYDGTLRVEIVDIVAGDDHDIVLTRESGAAEGQPVAWTGVHVWSLDQGRCNRFTA